MKSIKISISIVNHQHGILVTDLLSDLLKLNYFELEIIVTNNVDDYLVESYVMANNNIIYIKNIIPFGFGKNHNNAFKISSGDYFIVLNPDVRIKSIDFTRLVNYFNINQQVFCITPKVVDVKGNLEDSVRDFPSIIDLMVRFVFHRTKFYHESIITPTKIPWAAGIFLMFSRDKYEYLNGFDERYFMYMEDVDICYRISRKHGDLIYFPEVEIVHDARRNNRKKLKHFFWHLKGVFRFFNKKYIFIFFK
ncbi:MAG: glycosyltransferase family 2 protein [Crocinitomicaceae bacterium]|nr:glycosyltransferase family 2 protein [Crocinitomicaceae bacterium]MBP6032361.1 glycosyltransferase family 2 protein [Crocinitomicaceae bacterium]